MKIPQRKPSPNPIADFLVMVVLVAVLYMAIEALVYQAFIATLIPSNATFALPDFSGGQP